MFSELDLKDKKIIYELDLNSRQSASQIAKKIGLSKEVVNYRINRLVNKGFINYFYTILNSLALGYSHYKIYLKLQNIDPEKEKELIEHFIKEKNIIWVGSLRGNWDLGVSILAKNPAEFGKLYQKLLDNYDQYILEKNILIIEKAPTFNRSYLIKDIEPIELKYGSEERIIIDEVDKRILSSISLNARISIVELANKLNLTKDKVIYRIKKMKKNGLIQGFRTSFNLEKLGYSFYKVLFTFRNLNKKRESELIYYCKTKKNVVQYIKLIGSWDAEIEFEVKDNNQLHHILLELRKKFNDIIRNHEQLLVYEKKLNYFPF